MRFLGIDITRTKSQPQSLSPPFSSGGGGWFPVVRESYAGAWQQNVELRPEMALAYSAVFACITLISADIAKLRFKLTQETTPGVYKEVSSPAFTPVLSKPNHYQTHIQFKDCWQTSLSRAGNTYVLKQRDGRGVVTAMYILDPLRVQPLVASDGSVFYQLNAELLADLQQSVIVPASEIIHDRINCFFNPLIGVSPMFAAGLSAGLGLEIERNSAAFFANGAKISGIITAPGAIGEAAAKAVSDSFNAGYTKENAGKVAVLGDGLKFQQLTMSATDAQLIELLKKTAEDVCSVYHVPAYKVGFGPTPPYNNIEALQQQYYSDCLQTRIENMEALLNEGLNIPAQYSICLDLDGLLRMDQATMIATMKEGVSGGFLSPDEARARLGLPPVTGGDTPYLQQQNFSLEALSKRDKLPDPFVLDKPTSNPTPSTQPVAADPAEPAPDAVKSVDDAILADLADSLEIMVKQFAKPTIPEARRASKQLTQAA